MSDFWNGISLEGDKTEISKLKRFIEQPFKPYEEPMFIDFSRIVPIPTELELGHKPSQKRLREYRDWCLKNWHCSTNVGFSKYVGHNKIFFETFDGRGLEVIIKLSSFFPKITIYYFVFINDRKYFCTISNGQISNASFEIFVEFDYEISLLTQTDFLTSFWLDSDDELEYVAGEEPDIQGNYEWGYDPDYEEENLDFDPYKISDNNKEIEKIIKQGLCGMDGIIE